MPSPPIVLVADNDGSVAEVIRVFLERQGLAIEIVSDGRLARDRVLQGGVAALVCDLDMPVLSGENLIEFLGVIAPPTVVVSGWVDEGLEGRLRRSPAVRAVLRKPFDLIRFAKLVADLAHGLTPRPTSFDG